jgi:hypothetical protein
MSVSPNLEMCVSAQSRESELSVSAGMPSQSRRKIPARPRRCSHEPCNVIVTSAESLSYGNTLGPSVKDRLAESPDLNP